MDDITNVNEEVVEGTAEAVEETTKTYTEDELQAEVTKQLEEAKKSFDEQLADAVKKELEKSKMTAEEKAKAEFDEARTTLEKERTEFEKEKITLAVEKELVKHNLSTELVDLVISDTKENSIKNVEKLKTAIDVEVQKVVDERFKGSTPKSGGTIVTITQETFNKMSYSEKAKLFEENKELYETLTGGNQ